MHVHNVAMTSFHRNEILGAQAKSTDAPPVGEACFTAGALATVRLQKVIIAMLPYLALLFVLLLVLIVVPDFTLFLPRVLDISG